MSALVNISESHNNARYAKLRRQVGKVNFRIKNKLRVNSFVASRCVCVDTSKTISKRVGYECVVNVSITNPSPYLHWQELCGANFVWPCAANHPNATKANIEFVKKDAFFWDHIFVATNLTALQMFRLYPRIESREAINIPNSIRICCWIYSFGVQLN